MQTRRPGDTKFNTSHRAVFEMYLPRNFLAQLWRAVKDSDFAVPTGAAGGRGSF